MTEPTNNGPIGQTGKRWSPENPSPAMKSFAAYIKDKGYDDSADLETTVAATFVFHREWQQGHAGELVAERAQAKEAREAAAEQKKLEREQKKAEKEAAAAEKEAEKEAKRQQKEAEKAEKAEKAAQESADGDDTPANGDAAPRKRLRLKGSNEAEAATAGASAGSF